MIIKDLLKRIIDTCNYNEMMIDTDLTLEYLCMISEPLINKDLEAVNNLIIYPLMDQYRDADDRSELDYIKETISEVIKYLAN